jgi:hypothetical protein
MGKKLCRLDPKLFILPIMLFGIILQGEVVTTNPLPDPRDWTYESGPIPANYTKIWWNLTTPVFLKSEIINVTFSGNIAKVNATYTFKNSSPNATQLQILLPFENFPTKINLTHAGVNLSYTEQKHDGLIIPYNTSFHGPFGVEEHHPDHMIQFQLSFSGEDEITISATYERSYSFHAEYHTNNYFYNEFKYIIGTTRWWNHIVDSAHFEFRIKKGEFEKGGINTTDYDSRYGGGLSTSYQLSNESDFYILSTTFTDWLPEKDVFLFVYWMKKRIEQETHFPTFSFFLCIVLIASLKRRTGDYSK